MINQKKNNQTEQKWYRQTLNSWLPRRKRNELQECQKPQGNLMYSVSSSCTGVVVERAFHTTACLLWEDPKLLFLTWHSFLFVFSNASQTTNKPKQTFLYAIHLETFWWIETNVTEYIQHRRFIWPEWDKESLESPLAWKLYYLELKQRIMTPWMKYQATWMFVHVLQRLLNDRVSHQTLLRLNQHPPRRAMAIAERESDRLQLGVDVFVASIWANVIFLMANYTVDQIGALYDYYHKQVLARSRQVQNLEQDEQDLVVLVNTSWNLMVVNTRRLLYSAAGASLGSMLMRPGWGTLLGLGMGDEWARNQMTSELPTPALTVIVTCVSDLVGIFRRIRFPRWNSPE